VLQQRPGSVRCADSFNRITVDGDTSTNDACVLVATGASGASLAVDTWGRHSADFERSPGTAPRCASCWRRPSCATAKAPPSSSPSRSSRGTGHRRSAQVADHHRPFPLVKTAFFASDPNWGRILAAVGRAGRVYLGAVCIVSAGGRDPAYTEAAGQMEMCGDEILIRVLLGRGEAGERVWTTDFSYDYVKINAEYRAFRAKYRTHT
jgi:glutamate N-acetyltransferase / amino-acid N-acetyltransferase